MKRSAVVLAILLLISAGIAFWAQWVQSPREILVPLSLPQQDLFLNSDRAAPGKQPLLIVIDTKGPDVFARYITEILKAEGIFAFETIDLSSTDFDNIPLHSYALVITATQSQRLAVQQAGLRDFVNAGGRLLMLAPLPAFDTLLGIQDLHQTFTDGYVHFDSPGDAARMMTDPPLQFFGPTRACSSSGSSIIGSISSESSSTTKYPGFGTFWFGKGKTGFVMYDLGRSIVCTRQGRPPESNNQRHLDQDGDGVFRTADLFYGTSDYSKNIIPQADVQQKHFIKLIYQLIEDGQLIPRVWYFPHGASSVAVLTGDAHQTPSAVIRRFAEYAERKGGRFTLIDYPSTLDTALAHTLEEHGHTVAPHIYYQRHSNIFFMRIRMMIANWFSPTYFYRPRLSDLRDEVESGLETFRKRTGHTGLVTRTHFLIWWGWAETAQLFAQYGLRMDFSITGLNPRNQFVLPSSDELKSPIGYGYINGSGLPMRFINHEGTLINLFSQTTEVEDDVIAPEFVTDPPNDSLTIRRLIAVNRTLIDESSHRYHTALVWNFHPEHSVERWPSFVPLTWEWFTATVDHLAERGTPMLSAEDWLAFVQARCAITMKDVAYDPVTRSGRITLSSSLVAKGLTLLIPIPQRQRALKVLTIKGKVEGTTERDIRARSLVKTIDNLAYVELKLNLDQNLPITVSYSF